MEKHYPIIVTTLRGLIVGTKTLIGFYRREMEYIQRTNYQPLETTKSVPLNGFRFTEDRIDGEKTIILPADLAKAQKRKPSKKPKKGEETNVDDEADNQDELSAENQGLQEKFEEAVQVSIKDLDNNPLFSEKPLMAVADKLVTIERSGLSGNKINLKTHCMFFPH